MHLPSESVKKEHPAQSRRVVRLWWDIFKLRCSSRLTSWSLTSLLHRLNPARPMAWVRSFSLFLALSACAVTATSAAVMSVLANGAPQLHNLNGTSPPLEDIVILDPNRRDENRLSPGTLYDRPVAAVQTGAGQMLLRVRVEETLLTVRRDDKGLVVVPKLSKSPGENFIPRAVPQEVVERLLKDGGFCKANDDWAAILKKKLPARKLPGGSDEGGKLLVFEKKTVTTNENAAVPDYSLLQPEEVERLGLSKTTWSYLGFYVLSSDPALYQPVHFTLDQTPTKQAVPEPPILQAVSYDFFQWNISQEGVRVFGKKDQSGEPVALQPGSEPPMQHIRDWKAPTEAWFYDDDGWVYYGCPLQPGVMTPLLLESFSVEPDSPLLQDETRYRLYVRYQTAPLDRDMILQLWHSGTPINGIGTNVMSNDAANFAAGVLSISN